MHILIVVLLIAACFYFFILKNNDSSNSDDQEALDALDLQPFDPEAIDLTQARYAIALISGVPNLSVDAMLKVFNRRWSDIGKFKDMGGEGNTRKIGVEGLVIEYELQGAIKNNKDVCLLEFDAERIPEPEVDVQSFDTTVVVRMAHRGGVSGEPLLSTCYLSFAIGALTQSCKEVDGVWWVSGNKFLSRKSVLKDIVNTSLEKLQFANYLSAHTYLNEDGSLNGYTCGLREFGLDEFEVIESPESEEALKHRLLGLAVYAASNCQKILNGDTTGYDEKERIKLKKEPSQTVYKGWVFRLYY